MKMQFVGAGSAFNREDGQSNVLVHKNDKKLLIDCGTYCREGMDLLGYSMDDIDALYITHLHADHIGGVEELAFKTYFNPTLERPKLFCNDLLMKDLWEQSLRGGLESIQGKVVTLTEYFECHPVQNSARFVWENIEFTPVQSVHVMAGYHIKHSYGLMIYDQDWGTDYRKVFYTADTQFCPNQINDFYKSADVIFQDCETAPYFSGVHAHYDELETLPPSIKEKMWLYHYQPEPTQIPVKDGFAGIVARGQTFEL